MRREFGWKVGLAKGHAVLAAPRSSPAPPSLFNRLPVYLSTLAALPGSPSPGPPSAIASFSGRQKGIVAWLLTSAAHSQVKKAYPLDGACTEHILALQVPCRSLSLPRTLIASFISRFYLVISESLDPAISAMQMVSP